jgi:xanthine dehydrogenase accessory factor
MKYDFWKKLASLQQNQKPYVIVTLFAVKGSAPQEVGAKAVISGTGLESGTIGGGKLEAAAIKYAGELLSTSDRKEPHLLTWNLQRNIKMTCGGEVEVLFEHFTQSAWKIALFGAGHVAQALCQTLSTLECSVTCIDPRENWLSQIDYANIKTICMERPEEYINELDPDTFVVSITKGHAFDVPVLKAAANSGKAFPFIGVIGSDSKGRAIKSELKESGVSEVFIEKINIPLGLPLGNNDPAEIAISISAQLLQQRDQHGS